MKVLKKKWGFAVFLLFAVAVFSLWVRYERWSKRIMENKTLSIAKIEDAMVAYRQGVYVDFSFTTNNKVFRAISAAQIPAYFKDSLIGKTFPVVFSSKDPTECEILITPGTFKRYKIFFPDSLDWVRRIEYK